MESESNAQPDAPPKLITVNQVVAWNIAWLRRETTMRQEDLAERLGWPPNKVSEAETSWRGKRTREFNAHELVSLSIALRVPVTAFFIPPLDDGQQATYVFRPEGRDEDWDMEDLMRHAMPDTDEDTPVMASYRRRLVAAVGSYLGPEWEKEAARWLRRTFGRNALREGAAHIRALVASMLTETARLDGFADAIEEAVKEDDE